MHRWRKLQHDILSTQACRQIAAQPLYKTVLAVTSQLFAPLQTCKPLPACVQQYLVVLQLTTAPSVTLPVYPALYFTKLHASNAVSPQSDTGKQAGLQNFPAEEDKCGT